jgi:antitoxin CptB
MTDPEHAAPGASRPLPTDPSVPGISHQDASETRHPDASATIHPGASDTRRRRLLFRATHRGTYENDLIIGGFVKAHLTELTETDLDGLEAVMEMPDTDLADWLTGRSPIPPEEETPMLRRMRNYIRDSRVR